MMSEKDRLCEQRNAVLKAAVSMAQLGLATGSSGNVSQRLADGLLITASGIPYDVIQPQEIIEIDADGHRRSGDGEPSSEWRMHAAIYAERRDVTAIVHTHSICATAAATALRMLPVPHDEGRILFGDAVPVSTHQPPGTWDLAHAVVEALGSGRLVLIARHGAVAVGATLTEALASSVKLEEIARLALLSRQFRDLMPNLEADDDGQR